MRDLTDAENHVLGLLADAWAGFLELPDHHPVDQPDFCRAINAAQTLVFARPAVAAQEGPVGVHVRQNAKP